MNILKEITAADMITLGNAIAGLVSILFSIDQNFEMAAFFLVLAVLFDVIDGKITRVCHCSGKLGKDLDSLADVISFCVAPVVFAMMQIQNLFAFLAFIVFLCCGLLRLARFNVLEFRHSYEGMPITLNGIIVPLIYLMRMPGFVYPIVYLVLGGLMISSFRIKKIF